MNRGMKISKNVLINVLVLIISVLAASLCMTQIVFSRERTMEMEHYYQSMEQETVRQVREYLNGKGYTNSGVMLTRVVDGNENRFYTLTIHHGRIDRMDEDEREVLGEALEQFYFVADNCKFCHEFLVTD